MRVLLVAVFIISIFVLPSISAPPPGVPVVKIGRTISRTGFYEIEAQPVVNGIHFWYDWLNRTSNLTFVNRNDNTTYYLELIEYDDASDVKNVDILYRALYEFDGVVATFGPWSTALNTPAVSRTAIDGVPILFTAGAPSFYTSNYTHSFGMFVTAGKRLAPCMEEIYTQGARSAAIIASADPFQQQVLPAHAAKLRNLTVDVMWNQTVALDAKDFTEQIDEIIRTEPDIILCLMETPLYVPFLEQLRDKQRTAGKPPAIYNINGGAVLNAYENPDFEDNWALDGVFGATQWSRYLNYTDPVFESPNEFAKQYNLTYGYFPDFSDALAVMSGFILLDALERTVSFSTADVTAAIRSTQFEESMIGRVTFLHTGEINSTGLCVQLLPPDGQTQRDTTERQLLPVAPRVLAQATAVYPLIVVRPPGPKYTRAEKIGIIVGSTLAGAIVIAALIVVGLYFFNKKYHVLFFERNNMAKEANEW